MIRFLLSLLIGLAVGIGVGLYLGWVQSPVEYLDSPASSLDERYKEEYTVMIAASFRVDGDRNAALERLVMLGEENIPLYVQEVTERYISNSRNINDIRNLVALSVGLGRSTPIMNDYRPVTIPEAGQ